MVRHRLWALICGSPQTSLWRFLLISSKYGQSYWVNLASLVNGEEVLSRGTLLHACIVSLNEHVHLLPKIWTSRITLVNRFPLQFLLTVVRTSYFWSLSYSAYFDCYSYFWLLLDLLSYLLKHKFYSRFYLLGASYINWSKTQFELLAHKLPLSLSLVSF